LTLTFKLIRARDETRLPCEFGANLFSDSRDISYIKKKVTDSAKNRTLRSSLRVVKNIAIRRIPHRWVRPWKSVGNVNHYTAKLCCPSAGIFSVPVGESQCIEDNATIRYRSNETIPHSRCLRGSIAYST